MTDQSDGTKPVRETKSETTVRKRPKGKYIFSYGRALEPKFANPSLAGYYRPWRFTDQRQSGLSKVFYARTRELRISLDISQFPYHNVTVRIIDDYIVIEGKHDVLEDQLGTITRRFIRKYKLPKDVKRESVHGKYKKGFIYLWGEKSSADVEKTDIGEVEEKIKSNRIITKENPLVKRHQLIRNDVKPPDGRSDKRAVLRSQQKNQHRTQNREIIVPIAFSPGSPE